VFIVVLFLAFRGVACSSLHQEEEHKEKGQTTNSSLLQKIRGGGNKKKYIVTLKSRYESFKLCKERKEFNCKKAFRSGFTVFATEQELERMKLDLDASRIEDIEEDAIVSKMSPPWHLDRIDQNYLPLDNRLSFSDLDGTQRGEGVYVYVLDTGVQSKHAELRGKIDSHVTALDPDEDDLLDLDPDGHGTFCASLIAGRTTGVAPGAKIVSVRVLNSDGAGSVSDVVAGLEWTSDQILSKQAENSDMFKGAVVLLALGAPIGVRSRALENAVDRFARETNSLLVTVSGNQNADACASVPARSSRCMTVAATDSRDMNYAWNNLGRCVDVFAPGVRLVGACAGQNRCTKKNEVDAITAKSSHNDDDDDIESLYGYQSGTSMAAAVAAGAAARILSENPNFGAEEVKGIIIRNATRGTVVLGSSSVLYTVTYNRLLRLH
jgi:subtilisin family serine protease